MIVGPPDSEREANFQRNKKELVDLIQRVMKDRREGKCRGEIPFMDAMLQNYDSDDKVSTYLDFK